jgi:hypothetical protein
MSDTADTPGWQAIDRALNRLYPGREPRHYGTIIRYCLGGPDPLDGISAYKNRSPRWHWHFISYGLSELYTKESDDPNESGFGYELTFRLACTPAEKEPPTWALNFLQNLARYTFETGNCFAPTHHLDLNGPIALGVKTEIRAVAFEVDPQLGRINTPHGRLTFLQVVGITLDELDAMRGWNTRSVLRLLAKEDHPLLITDLWRWSLLDDPRWAKAVGRGIKRDGSSMEEIWVSDLKWRVRKKGSQRTAELTIGALMVGSLQRMLRGRIQHGRHFAVIGPKQIVRVQPAKIPGWHTDEEGLILALSPELAQQMESVLRPQRGTLKWAELGGFTLRIIPTEIKGSDGTVTSVVG